MGADPSLQAWTVTSNYWWVHGDLTRGILQAFHKAGVEIPFPQVGQDTIDPLFMRMVVCASA